MDVAERIRSLSPWYQSFDLCGNRTTHSVTSGDFLWDTIKPMMPDISGETVLDLGCNAGYFSFKMSEMGAKVVGIDNSQHYLEQARFCRRFFPGGDVTFIKADLDSFALKGRFRLVLALSILYHLKNPEKLLSALKTDFLLIRTRSDRLDGNKTRALAKKYGFVESSNTMESQRRELVLFRKLIYLALLAVSGSGHSLLSSLLDAHRNIAMSRELLLIRRIASGLNVRKVPSMICRASTSYTRKGRFHRGSGTSHLVPGMWNGKVANLLVMGDKNGFGTIHGVLSKVSFSELEKLFQVRFLILTRDEESHKYSFVNGWRHKFGDRVESKFLECRSMLGRAIDIVKNSDYQWIELSYDSLVHDTKESLRRILRFLDLSVDNAYLDACTSVIVTPSPVVINLRSRRHQ